MLFLYEIKFLKFGDINFNEINNNFNMINKFTNMIKSRKQNIFFNKMLIFIIINNLKLLNIIR
jgi:hypothetical protein